MDIHDNDDAHKVITYGNPDYTSGGLGDVLGSSRYTRKKLLSNLGMHNVGKTWGRLGSG